MRPKRLLVVVGAAVVVASAGLMAAEAEEASSPPSQVPRAECGPGSLPETGLQGQVPRTDRDSGRTAEGYRCG